MASAPRNERDPKMKKLENVNEDGEVGSLDPVAAQQELLITEIESADGHVANVLR